jgi:signal peptidase I
MPDPTTRQTGSQRLSHVLTLLVVLLGALVAGRYFVAEPLRIETASMTPTLRAGEHVLADKVSRRHDSWKRGDVVAFRRTPNGRVLVKRIVGLGGDTVALADGRLMVNGHQVVEPYAPAKLMDSVYFGPVRVPAGHVFVMGDHRRDSIDSRHYGTIPASALLSRVEAVIWPLPPTREGLS